jgi:hypothetical protein
VVNYSVTSRLKRRLLKRFDDFRSADLLADIPPRWYETYTITDFPEPSGTILSMDSSRFKVLTCSIEA